MPRTTNVSKTACQIETESYERLRLIFWFHLALDIILNATSLFLVFFIDTLLSTTVISVIDAGFFVVFAFIIENDWKKLKMAKKARK